jgi:hypothetical protein
MTEMRSPPPKSYEESSLLLNSALIGLERLGICCILQIFVECDNLLYVRSSFRHPCRTNGGCGSAKSRLVREVAVSRGWGHFPGSTDSPITQNVMNFGLRSELVRRMSEYAECRCEALSGISQSCHPTQVHGYINADQLHNRTRQRFQSFTKLHCTDLNLCPASSAVNMSLAPPFTEETARAKVKKAQDLWNDQYVSSFPAPSSLLIEVGTPK